MSTTVTTTMASGAGQARTSAVSCVPGRADHRSDGVLFARCRKVRGSCLNQAACHLGQLDVLRL